MVKFWWESDGDPLSDPSVCPRCSGWIERCKCMGTPMLSVPRPSSPSVSASFSRRDVSPLRSSSLRTTRADADANHNSTSTLRRRDPWDEDWEIERMRRRRELERSELERRFHEHEDRLMLSANTAVQTHRESASPPRYTRGEITPSRSARTKEFSTTASFAMETQTPQSYDLSTTTASAGLSSPLQNLVTHVRCVHCDVFIPFAQVESHKCAMQKSKGETEVEYLQRVSQQYELESKLKEWTLKDLQSRAEEERETWKRRVELAAESTKDEVKELKGQVEKLEEKLKEKEIAVEAQRKELEKLREEESEHMKRISEDRDKEIQALKTKSADQLAAEERNKAMIKAEREALELRMEAAEKNEGENALKVQRLQHELDEERRRTKAEVKRMQDELLESERGKVALDRELERLKVQLTDRDRPPGGYYDQRCCCRII